MTPKQIPSEEKIMKEIERMRAQGRSIIEIANRFGKSYSWALARVNPKYAPLKLKKAKS